MKKLLPLVVIATLSTTSFGLECMNTPDYKSYIKRCNSNEPKDCAAEKMAQLDGYERAMNETHGTLSSNMLKSYSTSGIVVEITYKNIMSNYHNFIDGLNNTQINSLISFLAMYPYDEYVKKNEPYIDSLGWNFMMEKYMIFEHNSFNCLNGWSFVKRYIFGRQTYKESLQDPQLKKFIGAIIEGNNLKALQIIETAKTFVPKERKEKLNMTPLNIGRKFECDWENKYGTTKLSF